MHDMPENCERNLTIAVNPGSTTTKIAVYRGPKCLTCETLDHPKKVLEAFGGVARQFDFRRDAVLEFLAKGGFEIGSWEVVIGRGGLTKPIEGGVYRINKQFLHDMRTDRWGEHSSNLGAPIAAELGKRSGVPAFVVDPPTVDELDPVARYSGHPVFTRRSLFHALSQRAAARHAAAKLKVSYEKTNFIVVHLGGGVSIGAHRKGRVVDVNDALEGEGPFSPERSGFLASGELARLCFSGKYTLEKVQKMITGEGGLFAYLGTNDCREVEARIAHGDAKAEEVYHAMAYQIAKAVGTAAVVLTGRVKAVAVTGGMSKSRKLVGMIRKYAGFIAPFIICPATGEMEALAMAAQAAMSGKIKIKEYR
jgi:butyrate kinase